MYLFIYIRKYCTLIIKYLLIIFVVVVVVVMVIVVIVAVEDDDDVFGGILKLLFLKIFMSMQMKSVLFNLLHLKIRT